MPRTSAAWSACVAQIFFTLLVRGLLQLHLHKRQLSDLAHRTLKTYRHREAAGENAVIWRVRSASTVGPRPLAAPRHIDP